jgi:selenocysteine-specific elongation factor
MQPVIIGTAGHIDHGKTALVKALTGTNTDRLKEEQERGITIELGYAFLTDRIAFIDVPGHERFIKNMVAGVATVDFALLVIAADDGIMPQTREHFDILQLLGIEDGVIAITKCDLADDDWIDLVEEDIKGMVRGSFLHEKPILRVDSLSGLGMAGMHEALIQLAGRKREQAPGAIFRLPIDRVFSVKGFGTVVTGSALSGSVSVDDKLELLPKGLQIRVRGMESQGNHVNLATRGMRAALNLSQVSVEDISRGDLLATPSRLRPTFMLDVECRILETSPVALTQRQRVRLHVGTKEVMARSVILDREKIDPGQEGLVQFRLEEPTATQRLDRYVIRRYSPQITIGGGRILDANPQKHRKQHEQEVVSSLKQLGEAKVEQLIKRLLLKERVISVENLVTMSGLSAEQVDEAVGELGMEGEISELEAKGAVYLFHNTVFLEFKEQLTARLEGFHRKNRLRPGAKRGEILSGIKTDLPDFLTKHFLEVCFASSVIKATGSDLLALDGFDVVLTPKEQSSLREMESAIEKGLFKPPDLGALATAQSLAEKAARTLLQVLVDQGKAVLLDGKLYFHSTVVSVGARKLKEKFETTAELTMSDFRTLVDTSRKYALPLLNYYDSLGYTIRKGDVRVPGPKLEQA